MKLHQIRDILKAEVLAGENLLDREVHYAFGSDLMSDVLAFANEKTLLLTGLTNPQVIRTAEMMDLTAIVFVRGKKPDPASIAMAEENNITLMRTSHTLYTASGLLYSAGLRGIDILGVVK